MLLDRSSTIEFRIIFYENRSVSQNPKKQSIPHGYTFSIVFFFLHLKTVCEEKYLSFIYFLFAGGSLFLVHTTTHFTSCVVWVQRIYHLAVGLSVTLPRKKKRTPPHHIKKYNISPNETHKTID